jgi:hypothetical protein
MPGDGVDETGRGGGGGGAAAAAAPGLHPGVQVVHGAGGLGVENRVHIVGPARHAQHGQGLVGRDHKFEAGSFRADELLAGERVPEPAGAERQAVGLGGHLAVQAEAGGAGAAPAQRGLAPGSVIVQGLAGVVVGPAEDGLSVVFDRFGAHHLEPRHGAALPSQPAGLK